MHTEFKKLDAEGIGFLTAKQASVGYRKLGIVNGGGLPPVDQARKYTPTGIIGARQFVEAGVWQRQENSAFHRSHEGFSAQEIRELDEVFQNLDEDGSGTIERGDMIRLLESLFPEMSTDAVVRAELVKLLQDVDKDHSGSLDFGDFTRLMRLSSNLQNRLRFDKERLAVEDTKFAKNEVTEFRKLFLASDVNSSIELSLEEFKRMIATFCPMGDRNSKEFVSFFWKIVKQQECVEGRRDSADFPEFLRVLRYVLDINFGGVKERTASLIGNP